MVELTVYEFILFFFIIPVFGGGVLYYGWRKAMREGIKKAFNDFFESNQSGD